MICFIDLENDKWIMKPTEHDSHNSYMLDVKYRLEELSGMPCLLRRYSDVTLESLQELGVQAVFISGNASDWVDYAPGSFDALFRIIREGEWPMFGLCGGHQIIARAHGARLGPMRALEAGEKDITDLSGPGYLKEWAFMPVEVIQEDPIFEGLDSDPVVMEVHYWEIKETPPGFDVLASTDACRIQMMKHKDKPIYGAQFHPEAYHDGSLELPNHLVKLVYPKGYGEQRFDGKVILSNFFRIAGIKKT